MKPSGAVCLLILLLILPQCATVKDHASIQDQESIQEQASNVVAVIAGEPITLTELEREYLKNSGASDPALVGATEVYEDFLERYVDFKLKVLEAEKAGYPEDARVLGELHRYRASFARPYLIEREVMHPILIDLYNKKKEVIHASHIIIQMSGSAPSPTDTMAAWGRIAALLDSVRSGMDFGDVAFKYSEDPSAQNVGGSLGYRGDLGWFTAGRMVKAFEDAAYATAEGEVSEPFRSPYGYHIVKVHAREKARPGRNLAHIMVEFTGDDSEETGKLQARIDSIQARLTAGDPFEVVASEMSDHVASRSRGGAIGLFVDIDRQLDENFYNAAFGLESEGDISDIVETQFGYHIIKLLSLDSLGTLEEEYDDLERQASNLPRMRQAEEALARSARAQFPATIDTVLISSLVGGVPLDSLDDHIASLVTVDSIGQLPIATLADSVYTLRQLSDFDADPANRIPQAATSRLKIVALADAFLDYAAVTHAALDLENRDEEFAGVMDSFRDGLILFELMDDSVWAAAAADSLRLRAHFEANQHRYIMPDRHRLIEVECHNDSLLARAARLVDDGMTWPEFEAYADTNYYRILNLDTVYVDGPTNSVYDNALELEVGERTGILPIQRSAVVLWMDGLEPSRPKTFEESQAEIINEIQTILEESLMSRLRREYDVETFPDRLEPAVQL